ncbi:MAG TPA: ABC transporter permease [Chloroflexota bacterium]|nr:ABC transporter permease [Chloroflexota bacterium]
MSFYTEPLIAVDRFRASAQPYLLALPFPVRSAVRRWRGMVGMVVGVGAALGLVMALMGMIGSGMQQIIGDFDQSGANLYITANGAQIIPMQHGTSPGTIDQAGAILSKVRTIPGVRGAVGVLSWTLQRQREGKAWRNFPTEMIPTFAVDGEATEIENFVVMRKGRWFQRGNEVVLGQGIAGSKSLGLGDSLRLNGQDFEIVGIGKLRTFGPTGDNVAYVDARALRQHGVVGDVLTYVAVQTSAPQLVRNVVSDFLSIRARSPEEIIDETVKSQDYQGAMALYWVLDAFILFVAVMFVSNMLGRSVAERRVEFGTLRAIGLPSRTILLSVAAEGVLIMLASYVFGFVLSIGLGEAVNAWIARPLHYDRLFAVDATMYAAIFAATMGLGIVAAYFPARAATHVDPLEVLRGV